MEKERIFEELKKTISPKRLKHTLGVLEVAKKLGEKYNISQEKIEIAVLMHDFFKEREFEELKEICSSYNYKELYGEKAEKEIIHGFAGAVYAIEKFKIYDINILNAIKYHTVGRENMSLLEKIVYISDGIEPGREYPAVNRIREITFEDIDEGILYEIEEKIKYLEKNKREIHGNTLKMKEYFLTLKREKTVKKGG